MGSDGSDVGRCVVVILGRCPSGDDFAERVAMVLFDVGAHDAERGAKTVHVGLEDLESGVCGVGGFAEPIAALADVERIVIADTSCLHGGLVFMACRRNGRHGGCYFRLVVEP